MQAQSSVWPASLCLFFLRLHATGGLQIRNLLHILVEFPWTIYLPLFLLLKMVMVKHTGVPCGISKENLKHSTANLWICSKLGDTPQQKWPGSDQVCHGISRLVGVLPRFRKVRNPEICFWPLSIHKSQTNRRNRSVSHNFGCKNRDITESRLFQRVFRRSGGDLVVSRLMK